MKLKDVATIKHGFPYKGEYFTDVPTKNILLTPTNLPLREVSSTLIGITQMKEKCLKSLTFIKMT